MSYWPPKTPTKTECPARVFPVRPLTALLPNHQVAQTSAAWNSKQNLFASDGHIHGEYQPAATDRRSDTGTSAQMLDSGTNPEGVRRLTALVDDLCLGYKLPGAGGGGYLYMVAKDPDAAARIRVILEENRQNKYERFVDMTLSKTGMQVSRS